MAQLHIRSIQKEEPLAAIEFAAMAMAMAFCQETGP